MSVRKKGEPDDIGPFSSAESEISLLKPPCAGSSHKKTGSPSSSPPEQQKETSPGHAKSHTHFTACGTTQDGFGSGAFHGCLLKFLISLSGKYVYITFIMVCQEGKTMIVYATHAGGRYLPLDESLREQPEGKRDVIASASTPAP